MAPVSFCWMILVIPVFAVFWNSGIMITINRGNVPQVWGQAPRIPEQIHLSIQKAESAVQVTCVHWTEIQYTLQYGPSEANLLWTRNASQQFYSVQNWRGYLSRFNIDDLNPFTRYYYRIAVAGNNSESTSVFSFFIKDRASMHAAANYPLVWGFNADWGTSADGQFNAQALSNAGLDFLIVAGDLTYSSPDQGVPATQSINDQWFRFMQQLATQTPLMVAVGNHEMYDNNAVPYEKRVGYSMPLTDGNASTLYYSFDYAPFHFIALSSETEFGIGSAQYEWFRADLAAASRRRAAGSLLYIIVYAHQSMYSSSSIHGSFVEFRNTFMPLFGQYGVDLALWGHDHNYERTYPINSTSGEVISTDPSIGSAANPYIPKDGSTIHLTIGCAGANQRANWQMPQPNWSRIRTTFIGLALASNGRCINGFSYGRFTTSADGLVHFEAISTRDRRTVDSFWMAPGVPFPGPTSDASTTSTTSQTFSTTQAAAASTAVLAASATVSHGTTTRAAATATQTTSRAMSVMRATTTHAATTTRALSRTTTAAAEVVSTTQAITVSLASTASEMESTMDAVTAATTSEATTTAALAETTAATYASSLNSLTTAAEAETTSMAAETGSTSSVVTTGTTSTSNDQSNSSATTGTPARPTFSWKLVGWVMVIALGGTVIAAVVTFCIAERVRSNAPEAEGEDVELVKAEEGAEMEEQTSAADAAEKEKEKEGPSIVEET